MKKAVVGILILIAAVGIYWSYKSYGTNKTNNNLVGGDSDENGCKASAGYSWCESKSKCLRVWEEGCPSASDGEQILAALYKKNNWPENEKFDFQIKTNDGKYASGAINNSDKTGGGLWFAQKVNGEWKIAADGNGIPTCEQLAAYPDFPNTLIKMCIDKTGNLVNR